MLIDRNGNTRICQYCPEPAVARAKGIWRCPVHMQELRHRQSQSAKQKRCPCGNHASQGNDYCSRCQNEIDEREEAEQRNLNLMVAIADAETTEDYKAILFELARRTE